MRFSFLCALAMALILPLGALADDQADEGACYQTCEAYRLCAHDALESIYNGTFQAECGDYTSCASTVEECRTEAGTCRNQCSDPQF